MNEKIVEDFPQMPRIWYNNELAKKTKDRYDALQIHLLARSCSGLKVHWYESKLTIERFPSRYSVSN